MNDGGMAARFGGRGRGRAGSSWRRGRAAALTVALVGVLLVAVPASPATASDTEGSEFWVAFGHNNPAPENALEIFVAGETATTGTVSIPGHGFTSDFTVVPGTVTSVTVPMDAMVQTFDGIVPSGIRIIADDEISVYGLNRKPASTDAFAAYPVDALGTDYVVLGQESGQPGTMFTVAATTDDTTVTITPSVSTAGRTAGVPYQVALDTGEVYQLIHGGVGDLSGSRIVADAPVAVFGGHRCGEVPAGTRFCDHLVEQLPPTSAWGTAFATVPLATRSGGDTFRIVADRDDTDVLLDGVVVATLDAGQVHERLIGQMSWITSSAPVLVAQYSNGSEFDNRESYGDPFMMLVPPAEQFLDRYTVATPLTGYDAHFLNLVVPTPGVASVLVDGAPLPEGTFSPIGSTGYSGAALPVASGSHTVDADVPVGVFSYGFGYNDSYGYTGGMAMAPVARVADVGLALSPPDSSPGVGGEVCAVATVTDQYGEPLEGVRVDFAVSGANPGSGFGPSDADGVAEHCYTGTAVGDDVVSASVGELGDSVELSWQPVVDALSVWLSPPDPAPFVGSEVCAVATVSDQDQQPFEGASVSFVVTGANPGSGSATTDELGVAEHCFTGTAVGDDVVSASVGQIGDSVELSWQREVCAPFVDVGDSHPFCEDIEWMVDQGLAEGWPDGTFRPGLHVSRQAKAAFLWRGAGSPAPAPGYPTFPDVPGDSPFLEAIGWMTQEGIAEGYDDGTYRPSADLSRQAMAAFLWRMAGSPTPEPGYPTFPDVPADSPFREAIGWMAQTGVTTGYEDGTYRPSAPTSRQAMAAFLHRLSIALAPD